MKKFKSIFIVALVIALTMTFVGCGGAKNPAVSISYSGDAEPVKFAIGDVTTALTKNRHKCVNSNGEYQVVFEDIDPTLGEQEYKLQVEGKKISITAGDTTGLMYGGLQLAEFINVDGSIKEYFVESSQLDGFYEYLDKKYLGV